MSIDKEKKYLLCRPRGGLNDSLVQIEKCWRYAEEFSRTLILDTKRSEGFHCDFYRIFNVVNSDCNVETVLSDCLINELENYSLYPPNLYGKLAYKSRFSEGLNFFDVGSKTSLTFDHSLVYSQKTLVHEQCGGGIQSLDCLSRLSFTNEVCESIAKQLASLFSIDEYSAIHVRHTDYRTDYKRLFSILESKIRYKKVLVCTDSLEVFEYAKNFFSGYNLVFITPLFNTGELGLHTYASAHFSHAEKFNQTMFAFADLIGLSLADQLLVGETKNNFLSGFSRLACSLNQNREIVKQLFIDELMCHEFYYKIQKKGILYIDRSIGRIIKNSVRSVLHPFVNLVR